MSTTYHTYGLELSCRFPLPGMQPRARAEQGHGLAPVMLRAVGESELTAAWRGSEGPPIWQGRLGDGETLTLQLGPGGQALFSYGSRGSFLLDTAGSTLLCAGPLEDPRTQRALLTKVLPILSVMLGNEALHAGSVDSPHGVIAILGPSGTGKTTLVVELMRRGLPLFSDDILILGRGPQGVLAYPGTPHMNVPQGPHDPATGRLGSCLAVIADERWHAVRAFSDRPRPVRMLCLLERGGALSLALQREAVTPLPLAPYMLGVHDDRERQRERFALYSDLAHSASTVRVTAGICERPRVLADLIESELASVGGRHAVACGAA